MNDHEWLGRGPSMYCGGMFQYEKLIRKGSQKDYRLLRTTTQNYFTSSTTLTISVAATSFYCGQNCGQNWRNKIVATVSKGEKNYFNFAPDYLKGWNIITNILVADSIKVPCLVILLESCTLMLRSWDNVQHVVFAVSPWYTSGLMLWTTVKSIQNLFHMLNFLLYLCNLNV